MAGDRTAIVAGGGGPEHARRRARREPRTRRAGLGRLEPAQGRQAGHGERTRRRAGVSLAPAPADDARRAPGRARGPLRRRHRQCQRQRDPGRAPGRLALRRHGPGHARALAGRSQAGAGECRSGPGALPGGSPQAVRGRRRRSEPRRRREGRRVARARVRGGAPEGGVGRRPAGRPGRRHAQSSRQGPPGSGSPTSGRTDCAAAVSAWIAVRGTEDGPLFRPVNKGGRVIAGGMSLRAIGKRVQVLGTRAGLGKVSPHMLRRSFATSLLSAGNDLSVTADLMGHARTDTTRLYDRRGESAKRAAASTISVPYVRPRGVANL